MTTTTNAQILRCLLMLACLCFGPPAAVAGDFSLAAAIAHGEKNSQAYDVYGQYAFSPWYQGESVSVKPLITSGVSLWKRPNKELWGGNVNAGLMLEFAGGGNWRSFISGTFGITILSSDEFDNLDLGCREQFRSRGSIGISFGENFQHTVQCNVTHYSNGSMATKNDGYNTLGIVYGFTF